MGYPLTRIATLTTALVLAFHAGPGKSPLNAQTPAEAAATAVPVSFATSTGEAFLHQRLALAATSARAERDFAAIRAYRPGFEFWQHLFTIPDGHVAYGSRIDGRLLATFPARGDWGVEGRWAEEELAYLLDGIELPRNVDQRREEVATVLEAAVGRVLHNPTRGDFFLPNVPRYGGFLEEWSAIYERFGVPADLGLAQAILESGLNGRVRSEAGATGLCQWLPSNWERLNRLTPEVIEVHNQTTQAVYCAAYLSVLSAKYGSFIPALSEHHAGGVNVGRTLINGQWLGGGEDPRLRYLMGADFARDLREISTRTFDDIVRTYGPRSFLYSEMVFGNAATVRRLRDSVPQERIYAVRAARPLPLTEISRETGLSADELKRFNPALVRQVPRGANLYLPVAVEGFGADVSFWHRPPAESFAVVLNDFVHLETTAEEWDDPVFRPVLEGFRTRFAETGTEEGRVMAAVLRYVMQQSPSYHRILTEYRSSSRILDLFRRGVREREALAAPIEGPGPPPW